MKALVGTAVAVVLVGCWPGGGASGPDAMQAWDDAAVPDAEPSCETAADCPDEQAPICEAPTCRACAEDGDCAARDAARPLCAGDGRCVACREAADCADPLAPFCDPGLGACRPCARDAECPSAVCDVDEGVCIDAAEVYYVDDDATCGAGDGSAAAPLCSIFEALQAFAAAPRNYVRVADGDYTFPPLGQPALPWFVGSGASVVAPIWLGGPCVEVTGAAYLNLRGFRLVDCGDGVKIPAGSSTAFIGENDIDGGLRGVDCQASTCVVKGTRFTGTATAVRCANAALCQVVDASITYASDVGLAVAAAQLEVAGTTIEFSGGAGVRAQDSQVTLQDVTIRDSGSAVPDGVSPGDAAGVYCSGGRCTLRRCRIEGGRGAGLALLDAEYAVQNCAIVENGATFAGAPLNGGVVIDTAVAMQLFANNTVVANRAGLDEVGGIRCTPGVTLVNTIVWGNSGLQMSPGPGTCTAQSSDIDQEAAPGTGNFRLDPRLASAAPGAVDVHLAADSLCIDAADPAGAPADDLDGDPRPAGPLPDVGADEYTP